MVLDKIQNRRDRSNQFHYTSSKSGDRGREGREGRGGRGGVENDGGSLSLSSSIMLSSSSIKIKRRFVHIHRWLVCVMVGLTLVWIVMILRLLQVEVQEEKEKENPASPFLLRPYLLNTTTTTTTTTNNNNNTNTNYNFEKKNTTTINDNKNINNNNCPSSSRSSILNDLTDEQRNPIIGRRWMVRPPSGRNLYLMCCDTTKGSFNILLHERWAPIGVKHLLNMIEGKEDTETETKQNQNNNNNNNNKHYFDTEIPFFRCTDACQFGLSSNKTLTKQYGKSIHDDPLWLPTGPSNRFFDFNSSADADGDADADDEKGKKQKQKQIKRYPKGVLTHAGAGNNSRSVQFVLTLKPNKFMGGGSPWETPLGEIVTIVGDDGDGPDKNNNNENNNNDDDISIPDIYTGYGEKGPGQALLKREGVTDESGGVRQKWPLLDYLLQCSIVDRLIVDET
jgi:hypothetical protein